MHFINNLFTFLPMFIALFWAIVLLTVPKSKNNAKHFLGIFMIGALGVYSSHAVYFSLEYKIYSFFDPVYMLSMLSVFPLYYCYIELLTVKPKFNKKNLWLFFPAVLTAITTSIFYLLMEQPIEFVKSYHYHIERSSFIYNKDIWAILQRHTIIIAKIIFFLQVVWVLTRGLKLINAYEKRLTEFYSDLEGRSITWAQHIVIIFSITGFMSAVANFTGRSFFYENHLIFLPSLVFGTLIFMIGYLGNLHTHTIIDLTVDEQENEAESPDVNNNENESFHTKKNIIQLKKKLLLLFEKDKLFKKPDLKISHVGELLNTNRTYVSRLINEEFSCSFSHFVNQYRVNEAKRIMENDSQMKLSIEEIADSAGYTSAGAFIRNFKLYFNTTPGTFRRNNVD